MLSQLIGTVRKGAGGSQVKRRGRKLLAVGVASVLVLVGAHAEGQFASGGEDQDAPPSPVFGIQVSGAFNMGIPLRNYSLLGFQGNPLQPDRSKACTFKLDIWEFIGYDEALHISLTAQLSRHFKDKIGYSVGGATLSAEPWQDESANPNHFFAKLILPPKIGQREMNPGTMHVQSHIFRSNGGFLVTEIKPENPDLLLFNFRMDLIENVTEKYNPRMLKLSGLFAVRLDRSPTNALRGFTGAFGQSFGEDVQTSSYLCAE